MPIKLCIDGRVRVPLESSTGGDGGAFVAKAAMLQREMPDSVRDVTLRDGCE